VASRSSSFPYKSIELFVNLLDVGYNGPYVPIFEILLILFEVHIYVNLELLSINTHKFIYIIKNTKFI
jgi:hypothetical protein